MATALAHEPELGRGAAADLPGCALALALVALTAVASRLVWFGDAAADFDEQLYSLIGAQMIEGRLPYVDLWDRKPFGLFALFAFAHWIGGPGPLAYQALATLFVIVGGWLVYALARPLTDRVTACGTGMLYPLLVYAYGSFSGQSEVFFLPLVLAMLWLVRDMKQGHAGPRAAAAMLLGGLALQIKYTVAPQCLLLGLVALSHFRREGAMRLGLRAAGYALLGLLPTLAVAAFYAINGALADFVFANFVSILERAPAPGGRFNSRLLAPLAPLMLIAAGGAYAALRLNRPRDEAIYGLYAVWSAAVLAGIFLPGTVYIYYFVAFVPCAALLAVPLLDRRGPAKWVPLALVLAGGVALANTPRHWRDSQTNRTELAALAQAIAPHVDSHGDCLLVFDGPTALYRLTESCLPSRFVYPDHLNNALERNSLGIDQAGEVARILASRPGAIVTADEPVTVQNQESSALVREAISRSYRPLAVARIRDRTIRAWARRD